MVQNHKQGFLTSVVLVVVAALGIAAGLYLNEHSSRPQTLVPEVAPQTLMMRVSDDIPEPLPAEKQAAPASEVTPLAPKAAPKSLMVGVPTLVPPGFKVYTSAQYGFSFQYPSELIVEEGALTGGTHFLAFKDPAFGNVKTNILYITDAPISLSQKEKADALPVQVGSTSAFHFVKGGDSFYWIEQAEYSLAISILPPAAVGDEYKNRIDLNSFTF